VSIGSVKKKKRGALVSEIDWHQE